MYQYFPHKQWLLYALNERYLEALAVRMEASCAACRGEPLEIMVKALLDTYWQAKTERADVTRALYRTAVELDNEALIEAFADRVDAATNAMLASAPDAKFTNLASVTLTLVTVIFGTMRNAFERNLEPDEVEALHQQMVAMCRGYLQNVTAMS